MNVEMLAKNWWAVLLRGVAAIIFGVLTAFMPGITLALLVLLFGGYAIVEGVFNVRPRAVTRTSAISRRSSRGGGCCWKAS